MSVGLAIDLSSLSFSKIISVEVALKFVKQYGGTSVVYIRGNDVFAKLQYDLLRREKQYPEYAPIRELDGWQVIGSSSLRSLDRISQ